VSCAGLDSTSGPECYKHGISWKPDIHKFADPRTEKVRITTKGVWHALWETLTGRPCPAGNPTPLRVRELFAYCPEISVESGQALGIGLWLVDLVKPDVLYDKKQHEAWVKFSIKKEELTGFRISAPSLLAQGKTSRSNYVEVKSADSKWRTFQSTPPKPLRSVQAPPTALYGDIQGLNVFAHLGRERLQYSIPVQQRLALPMPQLMVYYTILFWLGSLVRYDPHTVDFFMDSGYWVLFDGFMTQSRLWLLELFQWAFYKTEITLWSSR
jgi:YaaC-like Protein